MRCTPRPLLPTPTKASSPRAIARARRRGTRFERNNAVTRGEPAGRRGVTTRRGARWSRHSEAEREDDLLHPHRLRHGSLEGRQIAEARIRYLVGQLEVERLEHHVAKADFDTRRPAVELPPAAIDADEIAPGLEADIVGI